MQILGKREQWSESMKTDRKRDKAVKGDIFCSVFLNEQSSWINQIESQCHRGHLFCLALFSLLQLPVG